ncbi:platelet glycoprotein IX [Chaetodon auriga]|uniref:platelet glycoprotein IX n=1 Tax=Chaetodon auriga TaxID=39042 RepID=UPI004032A85E
MLSALSLAVLLLATSSARTTGRPCLCSALRPAGLQVNCSSLNLMELPHLPSDTTELHVQDNRLTSVSPGLFDRLVGLEKVSLSGNPFHCDCRIQYLRNWLLKNRAIVSKEPTCASPSSVAQKAITELTDDYFSPYSPASCTDGPLNTVMGVMLCCVIVLLLWCLRLAKKSTIILYIDERHSGFEAIPLQSRKPRHRRRRQTGLSEVSRDSDSLTCTEDLEKPLLNMDLLPQVLDVLHKKHNIRINLPERPRRLLQWNYKNTASEKQS